MRRSVRAGSEAREPATRAPVDTADLGRLANVMVKSHPSCPSAASGFRMHESTPPSPLSYGHAPT